LVQLAKTSPRSATPGPPSRAVKPRRFLPQLEALEARDVPAVNVSVIGGVLTAQCDGGFNNVTVDHVFVTDQVGFATISDGSSTTVVFDSEYSSIRINGGGGTTSNIHANAKPLTVQNSNSPNQVNVATPASCTTSWPRSPSTTRRAKPPSRWTTRPTPPSAP
jgi:hypothetical protein